MDLKDMVKMEDDFSLEREEFISASVSLGKGESSDLEAPDVKMEISEPKMKKPVHTIIENVELTRRGSTAGLF